MNDMIFHNDLTNFWNSFEKVNENELKNWLWSDYLFSGSSQVRYFFNNCVRNLDFFTEQLCRKKGYYLSVKDNTIEIAQNTTLINHLVYLFETYFGLSVSPKFYFIIGSLNCGATTKGKDIIIATEMYARDTGTDISSLNLWEVQNTENKEFLRDLVSHELAHLYQKYSDSDTLLAQCIKEGAADFIANKVVGIKLNPFIYDYGYKNEHILKEQFKQEYSNLNWNNWLYNGRTTNDNYPSDLGYFIGYRICERYFENSNDKKQAMFEILNIKDFLDFIQKSGYV
jgi:hypothetical protein